MTLTKKRKKILLIAIPAAVVVVVGAIVLIFCLLFSPKEEEMRLEIWDPMDGSEVLLVVWDGIEDVNDISLPLDFYEFDPPEGYVLTENAEDYANRFSTSYSDTYQKTGPEVDPSMGWVPTITFTQRVAFEQEDVAIGSYFRQEIEFGDLKVIYYSTRETSGAYWLYGNSLLQLDCTEKLQQNEMLELINRVNYDAGREPNYSPLELQRGGIVVEETEMSTSTSIQYFEAHGNPQLPEQMQFYCFDPAPEGFQAYTALETSTSDWINKTPKELEEVTLRYRNQAGDRLILTNSPGSVSLFVSAHLDVQNEEEVAKVQDVTVNGNPGFFYTNGGHSYLAWIEDYLTIEMDYEGEITQEEMLSLAESLVQTPLEEEASSAPTSE